MIIPLSPAGLYRYDIIEAGNGMKNTRIKLSYTMFDDMMFYHIERSGGVHHELGKI